MIVSYSGRGGSAAAPADESAIASPYSRAQAPKVPRLVEHDKKVEEATPKSKFDRARESWNGRRYSEGHEMTF